MKTLSRTLGLSPWLSLAVPLLLLVNLQALGYSAPGLFCMAVDSGGKELICGPDYTHTRCKGFPGIGALCLGDATRS